MNSNYLQTAIKAVKTSGIILTDYFKKVNDFRQKNKNIRDIVTEVDFLSEKNIRNHIKKAYPEHAFVGEELGKNDGDSKYVWYIDPIDGTVNYSQGIPVCAISLALVVQEEIKLGVIYNPFLDELYYATKGKGAFLNGNKINVSKKDSPKDCLFVGTFSADRSMKKKIEYEVFGEINDISRGALRIGSAALAMAFLASGRIDGFWAIDLFPWDLTAGIILIKEAGGKITDFQGNEIKIESKQISASNSLIHSSFLKLLKKINKF